MRESSKKYLKHTVPQRSVLGLLLFILFINDLYKAVEFSLVINFGDDTNPILSDKSMKKINKHMNRDLKLVVGLIIKNRLSVNTSENKLVIFNSENKIISNQLNFRISVKKLNLHPKSNT